MKGRPSNFFTNSKLGILTPDSVPIPLTHPAHVRKGGCFGDEGSRDSLPRYAPLSAKYGIRIIGTKPPRFPSATRMKSIYRRERYMPRAFFLSTGMGEGGGCHTKRKGEKKENRLVRATLESVGIERMRKHTGLSFIVFVIE